MKNISIIFSALTSSLTYAVLNTLKIEVIINWYILLLIFDLQANQNKTSKYNSCLQ